MIPQQTMTTQAIAHAQRPLKVEWRSRSQATQSGLGEGFRRDGRVKKTRPEPVHSQTDAIDRDRFTHLDARKSAADAQALTWAHDLPMGQFADSFHQASKHEAGIALAAADRAWTRLQQCSQMGDLHGKRPRCCPAASARSAKLPIRSGQPGTPPGDHRFPPIPDLRQGPSAGNLGW